MTLIPGWLRSGLDRVLDPMADRLVTARASPNVITTVGALVILASSVAFGLGAVRWAGALLLLSGAVDMVDGKVARGGQMVTKFGAFYDSTLDRIGEAATFSGIMVFFLGGGTPAPWVRPAVAVTLVALAGGLIVSYTRARAEGLGLDCRVGIATRAERILLLGGPTLFFGAGPSGLLLLVIVGLLALSAVVTVAQRMVHVYRLTNGTDRADRRPASGTRLAQSLGKGSTGG
jgi:CDP-diacylglycerol---glycerol-3-phosphate 3-phosphatidyltransferase